MQLSKLRTAFIVALLLALLPVASAMPVAQAAVPEPPVALQQLPQATSYGTSSVVAFGGQIYTVRYGYNNSGPELWRAGNGAEPPVKIFALGNVTLLSFSVLNGRIVIETGGSAADGLVFFSSDGTTAGTREFARIPGSVNNFSGAYLQPYPQLDLGQTRYIVIDQAVWRTDGTAAGTVKLLDAAMPSMSRLVAFGQRVLIIGSGMWVTDGTPAGTQRLTGLSVLQTPVVVNGAAVFSADDGRIGEELWRTDGTPAGTVRLRDIRSGKAGAQPRFLTAINGVAYFTADDGKSGREVWRSDGTAAGTRLLVDACPGVCGDTATRDPLFTALGTRVAFFAQTSATTIGLWRTDGSQTQLVTSPPIDNAGTSPFAQKLGVVNNVLLYVQWLPFSQNVPAALWRTDGTAAGTSVLRAGLTSVNVQAQDSGRLIFASANGLFQTDGTQAGTREIGAFSAVFVTKIVSTGLAVLGIDRSERNGLWFGAGSSAPVLIQDLGSVWGISFLNIGDTIGYVRDGALWRSDGTAAGTQQIDGPSSSGPLPSTPIKLGAQWLFASQNAADGRELWATDGTAAGTRELADICPRLCASNPSGFTTVGSRLLFFANDQVHGREPWVTDGTAAGTQLLADLDPGAASGIVRETLAVNGTTAYFVARDASSGFQLWRSDGTAAGTQRVTRIGTGISPLQDAPFMLTAAGGRLFYATAEQVSENQRRSVLWTVAADGTTTRLPGPSVIQSIAAAGDRVVVDGSNSAIDIWGSDGTVAGTTPLPVTPGAGPITFYPPVQLFSGGGRAFIMHNRQRLVATDGTAAGTVTLLDGNLFDVQPLASGLAFVNGDQLWLSDGTTAGTRAARGSPAASRFVPFPCGRSCNGITYSLLRTTGDLAVYIGFSGERAALYAVDLRGAAAVQLLDFTGPADPLALTEPLGTVALTDNTLLLTSRVLPQGPGLYALPRRAAPAAAASLAAVVPGRTTAVTVRIANPGLAAGAADVTITVPAGLSFVDSSLGTPQVNGSSYSWSAVSIPVGGLDAILRVSLPANAALGPRAPLQVTVTPQNGAPTTAEIGVLSAQPLYLPVSTR